MTGSKVEDEETSVRRSARTKRRAPRRLIGEEVPISKRLKTKGKSEITVKLCTSDHILERALLPLVWGDYYRMDRMDTSPLYHY